MALLLAFWKVKEHEKIRFISTLTNPTSRQQYSEIHSRSLSVTGCNKQEGANGGT